MSPGNGHDHAELEGGVRVLIVDDQADLRRAMVRGLGRSGHVVSEAQDGNEAIAIVAMGRLDVVVTDILMPGMDGVQLLRAVRKHDPDLPVVFVTGAPSVATAAQAVANGALAYLVKPVALADLDAEVRRAGALYRIARLKREAFALLGGDGQGAGDRARQEAVFERALDGLWVAYQPIVSARAHTLIGYEAFMRSAEPTLAEPHALLAAAMRLGRCVELGRLVRQRTLAALCDAERSLSLFLNLHPDDLLDDTLYDPASDLASVATRIVLELTERASISEVADVRSRVARLRDIGFRIAIDDLGAGYAGLTSFADLQPEIVKLDLSLIHDIDRSPTKRTLVRSLTSVCHDLGTQVVAEGVETVAERECVVELGCDLLQGYLLARPARAFPEWRWASSDA